METLMDKKTSGATSLRHLLRTGQLGIHGEGAVSLLRMQGGGRTPGSPCSPDLLFQDIPVWVCFDPDSHCRSGGVKMVLPKD